jgi:hypothetical protein
MKRKLAVVAFTLIELASTTSAYAQQPRARLDMSHKAQPARAGAPPPASASHPAYQRPDSWYKFLLKDFNPTNFDYGAWMEERRQAFLNESARNPYFQYGAAVTLLLLLTTLICAKQWIDYRHALWITAEMMADLYTHDHYSREVAEHAIRKYNDHIERCNRSIEANQNVGTSSTSEPDRDQLNAQLQKTASDLNQATKEKALLEEELRQKSQMIADLSLRIGALSRKEGGLLARRQRIDLSNPDPHVIELIDDRQLQLQFEPTQDEPLNGAL